MTYYRTDYAHWVKDITYARSEAFNYVMKHKKEGVPIMNDNMILIGMVWYKGPKSGPVYHSQRTGKTYLLDYDGEIYDMKTEKKVKTIIRKPKTEYGIKGKLRPFGL